MLNTNFTNITLQLNDYLKNVNCQTIKNTCSTIPNLPRGRQYHSGILYRTYNKTQEDSMCPDSLCGPLCINTDPKCFISDNNAKNYPIPDPYEGLTNFHGPLNESCPDKCCDSGNEFCFRTYANTGYEVSVDEEEMLIFGGLTQNEVLIDNKNIADSCDFNPNYLIQSKNAMNTLFLMNNCGYEIMNELWIYNIQKNEWKYIKPFIDEKLNIQQKPTARYGHTAVYVEQIDSTYEDDIIVRKYMYIYGGFSLYCLNACDDMWRYEISYAPQRYYPNPSLYMSNDTNTSQPSTWNRGNFWEQLYSSSTTSPGGRLFHSMVVDSEYKYMYLFGGISVDVVGKESLNNDLWRYDLLLNIWERIIVQGITNIYRPIIYWDGSKENIDIKINEYNEKTDLYITHKENENFTVIIPKIRSGAGFEIFKSGPENYNYFLLFGGLTWDSFLSYNLQEQLDDLWVYNIDTSTWLPVFVNSDLNPLPRYGTTLKYIDNSKFLLYGGINSDQTFNDFWLFNMKSNMWTQILRVSPVLNENDWPNPVKFPSLVKFSRGLVLYGGGFYINTNEQNLNNTMFISSGRSSYIINDLWVVYSDICPDNCSGNGICNYGRCICNQDYFDTSCNIKKCSGSFCFTDLDIFVGQRCYHCSGHGKCDGNSCICDLGWRGSDCSIQDCLNNCTRSSDPNIATCVESKPISQCICNQTLKRGGDDCSVVFCLNDCDSSGVCDYKTGICSCKTGYYGIDCSVYIPDFRSSSRFTSIFISFYLINIFLVIVL